MLLHVDDKSVGGFKRHDMETGHVCNHPVQMQLGLQSVVQFCKSSLWLSPNPHVNLHLAHPTKSWNDLGFRCVALMHSNTQILQQADSEICRPASAARAAREPPKAGAAAGRVCVGKVRLVAAVAA